MPNSTPRIRRRDRSATSGIRRGMSMKASTREAVEELLEEIAQDAMELILLFCAPHYDVPAVLAEIAARAPGVRVLGRSEEHTSALQSLMRTSSAVFRLKKKKTPPQNHRLT